jgi:hypothetical protein
MLLLYMSLWSLPLGNVPPRLRDGETRVRGDAQGGRVGVPSNFREISGVRGDVEVYIYIYIYIYIYMKYPFRGVESPTLGKRTPLRLPESPQKGDVGKRTPESLPVPGAWGARGARTPPWGTRPRGTLCASEGKDIDYLQMRLLSVHCLRMG